MKKLLFTLAVVLGLVQMAPAFAQVGVDANVNVQTTGAATNVNAQATLGTKETQAKERGGKEIDRRVAALTELQVRVGSMQKVTDEFKQALGSNIQTQISALVALKTKIQADTDVATLKTDILSINQSYRVFVLVIPQSRIAAAADRIVTTVGMMNTMGLKLQARIQAASQAGADVTAMTTALNDLSTQITEAQNKAQAAVNASVALSPDNGDKTVMAANAKVLAQARADLAAAGKALQAARKDIHTIVTGLKNVKVNINASSSTQVQTQ